MEWNGSEWNGMEGGMEPVKQNIEKRRNRVTVDIMALTERKRAKWLTLRTRQPFHNTMEELVLQIQK